MVTNHVLILGLLLMYKNISKVIHIKFLLKLIIAVSTLVICAITSIYLVSFLLGPPEIITDRNTIYYDTNEVIIGEDKGLEKRYWVDLADISPDVIEATIVFEVYYLFANSDLDMNRII